MWWQEKYIYFYLILKMFVEGTNDPSKTIKVLHLNISVRLRFGFCFVPKKLKFNEDTKMFFFLRKAFSKLFQTPINSFSGVSKPDATSMDYCKLLFAIFYSAIGNIITCLKY
jgi:hypothetical protein